MNKNFFDRVFNNATMERHIQSSNGKVYYWTNERISPQKVAIVFCHGLTADHTLFDKQIKHLSSEYKLITWDYPLHGKSRPYEDFTFTHVNKELLTILKQENIEKIILVGQSAGGYIAQSFIQEYKDKVIGFNLQDHHFLPLPYHQCLQSNPILFDPLDHHL
ncbi:alpha/beta fold hydrolase [Bacillus sp. SD088]|uniref:alpha/beta fold hydrolase n=1 Tax=Bacillus sp. SD088 TaxID=2782012 RepID=UPI001F609CA5|nr:alpha/beta hydrolase [Bacillus sp. SD088]